MSALTMGSIVKGAGATKDYRIDFGPFLKQGERVVSAVYSADPISLTIGSGAYDPTINDDGRGGVVWLSGGTPGLEYVVTVTFTTDNVPPRIDQRTFGVNIESDGPSIELGHTWYDLVRDFGADPTGGTDCTNAVNTAFQSTPLGSQIYARQGIYLLSNAAGVRPTSHHALVGPYRGMSMGPRVFNLGEASGGAQFRITHTAKAFTMENNSRLSDLEFYHPNQVRSDVELAANGGAPIAYDYLFDIPQDSHSVTLNNICAINPYQLYQCNAASPVITNLWSWPLLRGLNLLRVADTSHFHNIHFNGNINWSYIGQTNLLNWVQANSIMFRIGAVEEFNFTDCFGWGARAGLFFSNSTPGGPNYSYGSWKGGGFDQVQDCVLVDADSGLSVGGLALSDVRLVPTAGAGAGHGILFQDNHVPSGAGSGDRPVIYASNVEVHGLHDRAFWLVNGSYGCLIVHGGGCRDMVNDAMRLDSANAQLSVDRIRMPATATRVGGTSVGLIVDTNPLSY
jgi:hypothetical protein